MASHSHTTVLAPCCSLPPQYSEINRTDEQGGADLHEPPGRCARRCYALRELKIRGFRLPAFLGLGGSLVLPTADAWLDWSVTIAWYLGGDVHWAQAGLTINLVSGALSGLLLGGDMIIALRHWV